MGDIYRVTIVREGGTGDDYQAETVLEIAGSAQRVGRTILRELADLFDEDGGPTASAIAEQVMDSAAAAGAPVHPFAGPAPAKRTRRTKAQIAADEAAAREAAEATTVSTQAVDEPAPAAPAPSTPDVPAAGAAPFNPFQVVS